MWELVYGAVIFKYVTSDFCKSNRANFKSEKIWTRVLYVGPSMDLKILKNKSLAALSKIKKIPEIMSTRDTFRSFNAKDIFHL